MYKNVSQIVKFNLNFCFLQHMSIYLLSITKIKSKN